MKEIDREETYNVDDDEIEKKIDYPKIHLNNLFPTYIGRATLITPVSFNNKQHART